MVCNANASGMVGPEGRLHSTGTPLIPFSICAPCVPRLGLKGFNGLRAWCPTIRSGWAIRTHRLESQEFMAGTNNGTPGERPGNLGKGER